MRARPLGRPEGRVSAAACLALGMSLLACGGGGSGAATTQATGGGVTSTSAGTGNGSAPDSGTASGAAGTGGAVDASAGSGGTGTATQGGGATGGDTTGPGSASTGGSTTGGGAPVSSRCAALLPTPGQPIVTDFGWPAACGGAMSSPSGDVALGVLAMDHAPPLSAFVLFTPDGARLGSASAMSASPVVDPYFHPTAAGYQGITGGGGFLSCAAWDRSGAQRSIPCAGSPVTSAPTAAGGSVFVVRPSAGGDQLLVWTASDGSVSSTIPLGGSATLVLEAWQTAHVVAVDLSGAPRARWFDAAGVPLTPWFAVTSRTPAYGASLKLLVDGTVALHDGTGWTALLRDGAAIAGDPPAWLASRPVARIATIRGGNGYAALPIDPAGVATFEVLTADGQSCGNVTLPADSVTRLDCGYDGTVFVSGVVPPTTSGPGCRYRWWPALLR